MHRIVSTSGDKLVESGSVMSSGDPRRHTEEYRFKTPGLTTNAFHTPLYKPAITDEMETGELPSNSKGVVNISGMKAYTKPEAEEYRAEVRRRDRDRRDASRMQGHVLPVQTIFEERALKRRRTSGSNVEIKDSQSKINAEVLAKKWDIGIKRATQTLIVTTQKGIRNVRDSLTRRLPSQPYRIKRIAPGTWWTDTFLSKVPSITGKYKAAQVFSNAKG